MRDIMAGDDRICIAVIGAGKCAKKLKDQAYAVGRAIADEQAILVCGGLKGVMEAAARGAQEAGGTTVGIIPGRERSEANPFCDIVIPSGLGEARNVLVVQSADAVVALHGKYGTMSEMAFSLKLGKPLISLVQWDMLPEVITINDPIEAVRKAAELARHARNRG
jgi:uncharacterized protein (TIGR00725 family)